MVRKEYIDTFTSNMEHTGVKLRDEVHSEGLWHQTFHCWLWRVENGKAHLLFQRRHSQKKDYAGLLDITAAGHLEAGERPLDGVRELREELGIDLDPSQLTYTGVISDSIKGDNIIDNEFGHVFFHEYQGSLTDFRLQEDEVTSIVTVEVGHFRLLFTHEAESIAGTEFVPVHGPAGVEVKLTMGDFVPHERTYYEFILDHLASCVE